MDNVSRGSKMDVQQLLKRVGEQAEGLFARGSRYQIEKVTVVVAFVVYFLVMGTVGWIFGGKDPSTNSLGAEFGVGELGQLKQQLFFVENTGRGAWTNVRVVVNGRYVYTAEKLEGRERLVLQPADDLADFFYIPRPWGREEWEGLVEEARPGPKAPKTVKPELVQIRAAEGRVDIEPGKAASP